MSTDLGPILKAAYPEVVATLVRVFGDIDRAEDATQDALVKALQKWRLDGVPDNPVAWLVTVGRNRAVDQLRRDARSDSLDSNVVPLLPDQLVTEPPVDDITLAEVNDDMLRLMFTCCHPELTGPTQITLMLKVVLGFTVEEIARSLLISRSSVEKRLTRAKTRLRTVDEGYEVPRGADYGARLDAVLKAIYLLFNEGYTAIQDAGVGRGRIIDQAIRLGRIVSRLFRRHSEARSLLALMLLSAARLPGRLDETGAFVPLVEQDRSRWDAVMIREGVALVDAVHVARHPPGSYQIQAAISAIHSLAPSAEKTDWVQIVVLYEKLREYDASPVIPVNHAMALCYSGARDAALAMLVGVRDDGQLGDYQPLHAALAHVYAEVGNVADARAAYKRAIALAPSAVQQSHLRKLLAAL